MSMYFVLNHQLMSGRGPSAPRPSVITLYRDEAEESPLQSPLRPGEVVVAPRIDINMPAPFLGCVQCSNCAATVDTADNANTTTPNAPLLQSCACRRAVYCSRKCQTDDWSTHSTRCTATPTCEACGLNGGGLFQCLCRRTVYCSVACQAKHRGQHSRICTCSRKGGGGGGGMNSAAKKTASESVAEILSPEGARGGVERTRHSIVRENAQLKEEMKALVPWLVSDGKEGSSGSRAVSPTVDLEILEGGEEGEPCPTFGAFVRDTA